jgi:hypothetical protein
MLDQQAKPATAFAGSAREQEVAAKVLSLMLSRGMFMATDAPIRLPMNAIVQFLEGQGEEHAGESLDAAVRANPSVFSVEGADDERTLVTTKSGRAPTNGGPSNTHTFASRFFTPLPKPAGAAAPRPRPRPQAPPIDVLAEIELTPVEPMVEPVIEPAVEPEPVEEAPAALARTITTQIVKPTDVANVDDINLARAIRERFSGDPRVANFGEQWLMEDRVPRFSRGDLRRLRDYMQEKEQPLTDDDLAQDVLGVRPGSPEFDLMRFAIDYRLSSEHREFEFVGTANQRFWSTSGLPQIGTSRRKPNEIGTDFRFLLEETPAHPEYRSLPAIDHTLTFYEFIMGLLPYDAEMQALLPGPMTPGQKSAVLTFECPQSFTTYLVELRYPTPNRGGYILGLDDFYTDNLVPGALLSIQRTDNDGHYRVEYLPETAKSEQ